MPSNRTSRRNIALGGKDVLFDLACHVVDQDLPQPGQEFRRRPALELFKVAMPSK